MESMDVAAACRRIVDEAAASPRYAHTSHLLVTVDGDTVFDEHLRGPVVADVFSVTKTVLATVVGVAVRQGLVPDLDGPVAAVLPALAGTPSRGQTWRHLLTMTRGSVTDGPWDVDEVTALPGGQVVHVAAAPLLDAPGTTFRYDNGAAHLLSAALGAVVGGPVSAYAERELFAPLGITGARWAADPDGVTFGFAHLEVDAAALARLGAAWLRGDLPDPGFAAAMTAPQNPGGPPEDLAYGYLTWIGDGYLMAGGWAGQHVVVVPRARAVVVVTGDPGFEFGPPPRDRLPADWRPALDLVRRHLLPLL